MYFISNREVLISFLLMALKRAVWNFWFWWSKSKQVCPKVSIAHKVKSVSFYTSRWRTISPFCSTASSWMFKEINSQRRFLFSVLTAWKMNRSLLVEIQVSDSTNFDNKNHCNFSKDLEGKSRSTIYSKMNRPYWSLNSPSLFASW